MDISQLNNNGFALSSITTGKSMRPLIWGGQHCVAIVPLSGEPEVGDVLVFKAPQARGEKTFIVHRLVEIRPADEERRYITRGDNCLNSESVSRDEIIGRVAEVHRMSGFRPWHIIPRKKFAVSDRAYQRYSRLWAAIWPLRRLYYLLRAHAHGLCHRILKLFRLR